MAKISMKAKTEVKPVKVEVLKAKPVKHFNVPNKKDAIEYRICGPRETITFRNAFNDVVYNSMNNPIKTTHIPPFKVNFKEGYWSTKSQSEIEIIMSHKKWGKDVYWDASMEGTIKKLGEEFDPVLAKELTSHRVSRAIFLQKQRENRVINGPVPKDE